MGLHGVLRLFARPFENNYALSLSDMNDGPELECTYSGIKKIKKKFSRYLITVDVATESKWKYSSIVMRRNWLFFQGKGPFQLIDIHSNSCVAFISWTLSHQ